MRRITGVLLLLLTAVAPHAALADAKGKRVAFFVSGPTHPWVAALSKSFLAHAKELGLEVTEFDTPYDSSIQSQQVDDAVARKFDLLAIEPASDTAILPALARAKAAKIPVVIVNTALRAGSDDYFVTYVGADHFDAGKKAGQALLASLKAGGRDAAKVALITGNMSQNNTQQRIAGFKDAIKANPKVTIVATEDAKWETAPSEQIAGQLFARFASSGGLDGLYAMADNQAIATIRAADASGVKLGEKNLIVVGSNCDSDGIKAIRDGRMGGTVTFAPGPIGNGAADAIAGYFSGKQQPKVQMLPVDIVDKADVEKWAGICTF
jgi:ribose transport system substrate-binding protein